MSILGMHRISRGEIIGMVAMRGMSGDGEARGELKPLGNTCSVLFGRGGGRPDQLACRRWRADNVPAVDPGRSARSRPPNERTRPAPRLPQPRLAYPQQVARRTQTVALVAPRHERNWWAGWSTVAGLDRRPEFHVPRALVGARRHGPVRAGAVALPLRRERPPRPRPRDGAVAAC